MAKIKIGHSARRKRRVKTADIELHRDEWDFREVRQEELVTACIYEYTRSAPIRATFEEWHSQPVDLAGLADADFDNETAPLRAKITASKAITVSDVIETIGKAAPEETDAANLLKMHLRLMMPFDLAGADKEPIAIKFPSFEKPWAQLRREFGDGYLKSRLLPGPVGNAAVFEYLGPAEGRDQILEASPSVTAVEFFVDWNYSLDELTEQFRRWAASEIAQSTRTDRRKSGRRDPVDCLRWLAAYRLTEAGYSYEDASNAVHALQDATRDEQTYTWALPEYGNKSSWSKAVRKARERLAGDFDTYIRNLLRVRAWSDRPCGS